VILLCSSATENHLLTTCVLHYHYCCLLPLQVVDFDKVLQVVMEILRLQQSVITTRLKKLFIEGDDNHDGVLSYDEFTAIINHAAPEFSERRVARM
jgi:Ca2+-binding EF-hand superfamily protein